jgi:hypothetical protein
MNLLDHNAFCATRRPHARPLPMPVHATDKPCSTDCYKLQPGAVSVPLGHPQMPPAPLERMDSMPKRRGKGRWRSVKRACLPNGAAAGNGGCALVYLTRKLDSDPRVAKRYPHFRLTLPSP